MTTPVHPPDPVPLRQRVAAALRRLADTHPAVQATADTEELLRELSVYQTELEAQNEALRRTQRERDTARARYVELYNRAPVGYCTVCENGVIIEANLTLAILLGVDHGSLAGQPFSRHVLPVDQDKLAVLQSRQLSETPADRDPSTSCELRMVGPGAAPFWAQLVVKVGPYPGQECEGAGAAVPHRALGIVLSDISARRRAEEALHLSREQERISSAARRAITQGVLVTGPDGCVVSANDAFHAITGYAESDIIGRHWSFLDGPETDARMLQTIGASFSRHTAFAGQVLHYRKDGRSFWNELTIAPVFDPQGSLTHFVCVVQDNTERKHAQAAWQDSDARFRNLTTLSSDWFWEQDENFRFTSITGMTGTDPLSTPEAHIGKTRWELPYAEMDESDWDRHRAQLARHEVYHDFQLTRREPDGSLSYYLSSGLPTFDLQGRFTGYRGVGRDITREKQAVALLATTVRRFEQVLSNLYGGILLVSNDDVVEYVNQGFCDLFRLHQSPGQLLGMSSADLLGLLDGLYADPAGNRARIKSLVAAGRAVQGEEVLVNNNVVYLRDFIPITVDGRNLGRLWVHLDITASKRAAQALQASLHEKEALLREVHHRVKNNLQVITSLLRLESYRSAQPDTRSVLDDMQGRIRTMAVLHESLHHAGLFSSVDLGAYLRDLVGQVFRAHAQQGAQVRLQLALVSVQVGMEQATPCGLIVNELVSNSLKHGFPGGHGGEVRVELRKHADTNRLELQVSDSGVGLPSDFETRRGQSLGLQLVSDLVGQIDGQLEVGIAPGQGACFTISCQCKAAAPLPAPQAD